MNWTAIFNAIAVVCALGSVYFAIKTHYINKETREIYRKMRR